MAKYILFILTITLFVACKHKKKEPPKAYLSALSLIRSQVAHVDTSLYPILRIDTKDSLPPDTIYLRREEFGANAKDFLDIPDLSDPKVANRFTEQSMYDKDINRYIFTYTPKDPSKEDILREELLVIPQDDGNNKINTIIVQRSATNRDSSVQKNLLWQIDKYFQVSTVKQLPGQPETVTTTRVTWNEDHFQ